MNDPVAHPAHYTSHPSGVETLSLIRDLTFDLGSIGKYLIRYRLKNGEEDLRKAHFLSNQVVGREPHVFSDREKFVEHEADPRVAAAIVLLFVLEDHRSSYLVLALRRLIEDLIKDYQKGKAP